MFQKLLIIARALLDGLLLRCPNCHRGHMFESFFKMRPACPVCGMPFERSVGEVTGGMAINFVATGLVITVGSLYYGLFSSAPLSTILIGFGLFAILFPILFYPVSRGLWVGILFLTSANAERD